MPRKKKALKPEDWQPSGFCLRCMKRIATRFNGKEVRHVDGTSYCVLSVQRKDHPSDEKPQTEDTSRMQDEAISPEEDDF